MIRNIVPMGDHQEAAATSDIGPVFVTGGPGSGKTQVLVGRLCHLVLNGARADEMVVLTPDGETAGVFEARLALLTATLKSRQEHGVAAQEGQAEKDLLNILEAKRIPVTTLHQYASELLRQIGDTYKYTVWDDRKTKNTIAKLASTMDGDRVMPKELDAFHRWYGSVKLRNPLNPRTPPPHRGWLVLEQMYDGEKSGQRALDQHDLLPRAIETLEDNPVRRWDWASTHTRHIIVDGAQDMGIVGYRFLKLLVGPTRSVSLAADLAQRVSQETPVDPVVAFFLDHARDIQRHHLPISYRLSQGSWKGADNLAGTLAGNASKPNFRPSRMGVARLGGLPPLVLLVDGPLPFLYGQVVNLVRELTSDDPPENVAMIFTGIGFPVGNLQLHLLALGWPYRIRGTLRTVSARRRSNREIDRGVVPRIIHLLRCILNPWDLESLVDAMAGGPTHSGKPVGDRDQNRILDISRTHGVDLIHACEMHIRDVDRRSNAYRYLRFIADIWRALEEALEGGIGNMMLKVPEIWAGRTGVRPDADPAWRIVVEAAERASLLDSGDPLRDLGLMLDQLDPARYSGRTLTGDETAIPPVSGLTLTTVDAARGREWENAIVIGTPDQAAPFDVSQSHDTRETDAGQRRLHVAATRTRGRIAVVIHGRHGEGEDAARLLVETLGEGTEYRKVGPPVPADHDMPREGLDPAHTEAPRQDNQPMRRPAR